MKKYEWAIIGSGIAGISIAEILTRQGHSVILIEKNKKFIQKLMIQIKENNKELFIVNDKLGTPTYTHDFAKNVKLLVEKEIYGLFNMVCEGVTGRLEVAKELIKLLDLQDEIAINEVDSNYFNEEYFADRPASERLVNKNLNDLNLNIMKDWKVSLKEYLKNYYKNYLK